MRLLRLLDLPVELRELVYGRLPVRDRVRFNAALPRPARLRAADPGRDRRLGVLHAGVAAGKVTTLPRRARDFLESVPKSDPTLAELAATFPEVATMECVPLEIAARTCRLTATDADRLRAFEGFDRAEFLAKLDPTAFAALYAVDELKELCDETIADRRTSFVYTVISTRNEPLLEHLLARTDTYGLTRQELATTLVGTFWCEQLCKYARSRELLFKHLVLPDTEVRRLYDACVEAFDVDAMEFLGRRF